MTYEEALRDIGVPEPPESPQERPYASEQLSGHPTSQTSRHEVDAAPNGDGGQNKQHQGEHEQN